MARKLKIEIDVDSEKAKRKLREIHRDFLYAWKINQEPSEKTTEDNFRKAEKTYHENREWQEKLTSLNTIDNSSIISPVLHEKANQSNQTVQQIKTIQTNEQSNNPVNPVNHVSEIIDKNLMDALDSLARVGGNFAGSDQGFRDLQRVNEKQVALLEKIEAKTGKGAGKF